MTQDTPNAIDKPQEKDYLSGLRLSTRVRLLRILTIIGTVILTLLGINLYRIHHEVLSYSLAISAASLLISFLFLRHEANYNKAMSLTGLSCIFLGWSLIFSGSVEGTGLFWAAPLTAICLFTTRFLPGLMFSSVFISVTVLSWWLEAPWSIYEYSFVEQSRFVVAFLIFMGVCVLREYTTDHSLMAIDSVREALDTAANTDPLTNLFNRRFIHENYIRNDQFTSTLKNGGALLLADIDHFKRVNDKFGHDVGDETLKMVANILTEATRANDILARWGGEEFLIILPGATLETGYQRAQQFIERVESETLYLDTGELKVTISMGVSHTSHGYNAKEVLNKADEKLYKAKAEGRNRVR